MLPRLIAAHGVAHTLAFAVTWKLAESGDLPYTTSLFDGRLDVGDAGIRVVGLLWLIAAVTFVVAAMRVGRRAPAAIQTLAWASGLSALLCLTQAGQAQAGLAINGLLLVALAAFALARRHDDHGDALAGEAR